MFNLNKIMALQEAEKGNFGAKVKDIFKNEINPMSVSLQELAQDFLGSDYKTPGYITKALREAEGGMVTPSTFSNINAFTSVVGGLIDAMVMSAYGNSDLLGPELVTTQVTRTNGGKVIRVGNDGGVTDTNYAIGAPLETVGLKEEYVTKQPLKRRGRAIQLNELTFLFDRTDQIQSAAANAGFATAYEKELEIIDALVGTTNTYSYNDTQFNTYQTSTPWINQLTNTLNDYTDISEAYVKLWANTDPATGYPLPMDISSLKLVVSPTYLMAARAIMTATQLRTNTASEVYTTISGNPLSPIPVLSSQTFSNRNTNAKYWNLVDPRWACYYQVKPFGVIQGYLSSEDQRRGIAAIYICEEIGSLTVLEPRFVFQSTGAS